MGDGEVLLTAREADRAAVIQEVVEERLRQSEAARRLGLSVRQVKRLEGRYRDRGAAISRIRRWPDSPAWSVSRSRR